MYKKNSYSTYDIDFEINLLIKMKGETKIQDTIWSFNPEFANIWIDKANNLYMMDRNLLEYYNLYGR